MNESNFDAIVSKAKDYTEDTLPSFSDYADQDFQKAEKAQSMKFREDLVSFIIDMTKEWFRGLGIVFAVTGVSNLYFGKPFMSDSVLIALIGGTSFMSLIAIILRSLFKEK